jgi:hypothetical protein
MASPPSPSRRRQASTPAEASAGRRSLATTLKQPPGWRNGIRDGLKHHCPKGLAGSNPAPGTTCAYLAVKRSLRPILRGPMGIESNLAELGELLSKAREELRILDEQILFQSDVFEEAKTRMLVAETPLADREYRIARDDLRRMESERARIRDSISELQAEQDRLLDRLLAHSTQ